jgi:hypothetical protein
MSREQLRFEMGDEEYFELIEARINAKEGMDR